MEKDFIFTKELISEIFKEEYVAFTLEEIEEIMDEELEKDQEEMDTDLIDICAEILVKQYAAKYPEQANNYRRKIG